MGIVGLLVGLITGFVFALVFIREEETLLRKELHFMGEIDDALAAILVKVQATDGKADSLIVLFNGLKDQLLNVGKLTDAQKAAVAAIMDEATAQATEIDEAVNTVPPPA